MQYLCEVIKAKLSLDSWQVPNDKARAQAVIKWSDMPYPLPLPHPITTMPRMKTLQILQMRATSPLPAWAEFCLTCTRLLETCIQRREQEGVEKSKGKCAFPHFPSAKITQVSLRGSQTDGIYVRYRDRQAVQRRDPGGNFSAIWDKDTS